MIAEIKANIDKICMGLMFIIILSAGTFILFGCKSFDPVQIKDQPAECNDMYSAMRLVVLMGSKESNLVALSMPECQKVRQKIRKDAQNDKCQKRVFGESAVNREDYKKYAEFSDCLKE